MDSEIRKHYFLDKYVIIAPKRAKRPFKTNNVCEDTGAVCKFCPDNLAKDEIITYKLDEGNNWKQLSIINKFGALSLENHRAFGQQEIVIETNKHNIQLNDLSITEITEVINTYTDRYLALNSIKGINYVLLFKNKGIKAGSSIPHSHSQIYALPIIPPDIKSELLAYDKYKIENNSCPFCDAIKDESRKKRRIIWEDDNFFALSPFASQYPYGAWVLPKRHISQIDDMSQNEKKSLAKALKIILGKLDQMDLSYNYYFHSGIYNEDYHFHVEIAPRPNVWAGFELGTGIIVNAVSPEDAAEFYRSKEEIAINRC